jgi:outer membrane protein assembly factor BamB/PKD repeat protein
VQTTLTGDTVAFTAADSTDPDGDIVAYDWSITAAADASNVSVTRTFADDGNYSVTLRVTDDQGAVDTATTTVVITNRPPIPNGTVTTAIPVVGDPVAFSAAESLDTDGDVVQTRWDLDGDGQADSNVSTPTTTYTDYGEQTATVTVIDDDGARNKTTFTFDVNAPPTPAVTTTAPVLTAESLELSAVSSADPDGTIETYEWDLDSDGTSEAAGSTTSVEFADDGTYPIQLTVTDNDGTARSLTRNVTVVNRPPNATATANDTSPTIGEPVMLDASESTDLDGAIAAVAWDLNNDGSFNVPTPQITNTFHEPGTQTVTVRVTDDDGATAQANVTVDVNAPPEPRVNVSDPVFSNELVTLNASESVDPDGSIVAYDWTIEAAPDTTGATVTQSFADNGVYEVTLTVTDNDGATASVATNVTVQNRPPELWLTRVSPETTPIEIGEPVEYNVEAVDDDGTTRNATLTLTAPTGATQAVTPAGTATVRFNGSGNWSVTATVTDDDGATATTTRTVAVNAPPNATIIAPSRADANEQVTVEANATDPDGNISEYDWVIDEQTYTGQNVTFNSGSGRLIPISLRVTDADGATTVVNESIEVNPGLDPRLSVRDPQLGNRVLSPDVFVDLPDGVNRSGVNRSALTYEWDLNGDGQFEATGRSQDRVIDTPGVYDIAVRVNAPSASPAIDRETVTVDSVDTTLTFEWQHADEQATELTGDSLYVVESAEERFGNSSDSTVRSLLPDDGATRWSTEVPFYVGETRSTQGAVYAIGEGVARIDPDSGTIEWSLPADEYAEAQITSDSVYVVSNQSVVALNKTTGAVRWDTTESANPSALVAAGETVITRSRARSSNANTKITARDAATGAVRWEVTRDDYATLEGIVENRLIMSEFRTVTAYDVASGEVAWSQQPLANQSGSPYVRSIQIDRGTIYINIDQGSAHSVAAIGPDAERQWIIDAPDYTEMGIANEHVILAGEGVVSAYDRTDGSVEWNRTLSAESPYLNIQEGAALVEYNFGERGAIFNTETGDVTWQSQTDYVFRSAVYGDGILYVNTAAGVYAITDSDATNTTVRLLRTPQ